MNYASTDTPPECGAGVRQSRRRSICAYPAARASYPPTFASAYDTVSTEEDRAPLSGGVNRPESEVGDHSRIPLVHFRLFEQLKRRNVFRVAALYLVQRPLDFLEARLLSQRVEPRVYLQIQ